MPLKKIGVLELGKICLGETANVTLDMCIAQAIQAERLGFTRFWLAEHHESTRVCALPLMFLPILGKATQHIRLGTAGVLLPLHLPISIAESFAFLELLFPGRIDCGLAGGLLEPEIASQYGIFPDRKLFDDRFQEHLQRLTQLLRREYPDGHRLKIGVSPIVPTCPDIWLMGVSGSKRRIASEIGANYTYSLMHRRSTCEPNEILSYYKDFRPGLVPLPNANVAIRVACAETYLEAKKITMPTGLLHPQVVGNAADCLEQLEAIVTHFNVEEVIVQFEGRSAAEKLRACAFLGEAAKFLLL